MQMYYRLHSALRPAIYVHKSANGVFLHSASTPLSLQHRGQGRWKNFFYPLGVVAGRAKKKAERGREIKMQYSGEKTWTWCAWRVEGKAWKKGVENKNRLHPETPTHACVIGLGFGTCNSHTRTFASPAAHLTGHFFRKAGHKKRRKTTHWAKAQGTEEKAPQHMTLLCRKRRARRNKHKNLCVHRKAKKSSFCYYVHFQSGFVTHEIFGNSASRLMVLVRLLFRLSLSRGCCCSLLHGS